ncbi:MAG: hypothetical protein JW384_00318 [Nitrosomonadaceae bacterium]|nr:hypothetical protein [Nitrosomonadaceae bacterium]
MTCCRHRVARRVHIEHRAIAPVKQPNIVGCGEGDGPTDVQRGIRPKNDSGGVHQKEVRVGIEPETVDGAKNSRGSSSRNPAEYVPDGCIGR